MIVRDVVKWLVDNEYMQVVNGQLVVLRKLNQEIFSQPQQAEVVKPPPTDRKELWKKFIKDAEIPSANYSRQTGNYYLHPYSAEGGAQLFRIVNRTGVDYDVLVASTKHYYKTIAYKKTLLNYLRDGLWEEVYNLYLTNPPTQRNSGENIFER